MVKASVCLPALLLVACQSSTTPNNAPPPAVASSNPALQVPMAAAPDSASNGPTSVGEGLRQKADSALHLKGLYLGWNGPCTGKPPTRSAWQLADSSDASAPCVYIDGPAVPDAAPNAPPPNLTVVVRGKLVVDGNDRYIKASSVEKL